MGIHSMAAFDSEPHTHPSLLVRVKNVADQAAWSTFVEVYGPMIYGYCRKHRWQESDAADLSQEVLLRLARVLQGFEYRPEKGRFRDWLGTVIRNEIARYAAKLGRNPEALGTLDQDIPGSDTGHLHGWDEHFHSMLLHAAMNRIQSEFTASTWQAFIQLWIENKPPQEIATSLNTTIDNLYVSKSRVLKRLRSEIVDLSDDSPWMR